MNELGANSAAPVPCRCGYASWAAAIDGFETQAIVWVLGNGGEPAVKLKEAGLNVVLREIYIYIYIYSQSLRRPR